MIRFYGLRFLRDYIGHIILVGLPIVLIVSMVFINQDQVDPTAFKDMVLYIGLIYVIMFQGFGTAYVLEGIEHDFFKPFKARLMMAPVSRMKFLYLNLFGSLMTTLCQTLIVLGVISIIYELSIPKFGFVLLVLIVAALTIHLIATCLILIFKKQSVAQAVMTAVIIISMLAGGYFIPFESTKLTDFLNQYGSPIAWTHTSIYGFIDGNSTEAFLGIGLLITLSMICILYMRHALKKVL